MSDAAPESQSSFYKLSTWLLLAALIGVYSLYNWHQGKLKQGIAARESEISQTTQRLSAANAQIAADAEAEQGLKAEIAKIQAEGKAQAETASGQIEAARAEIEALSARVETANQSIAKRDTDIARLTQELADAGTREQGLNEKIDTLTAEHAADRENLEGKLSSAAQAHGELQTAHDGAQQRIAELEGEVASLQQSMADAEAKHVADSQALEAKHAADSQALEEKLKERISFYRTALEGTEPDRAAKLSGLELQIETGQAALTRTEDELAATRRTLDEMSAEMSAKLQAAESQAQVHAQTLADTVAAHAQTMEETVATHNQTMAETLSVHENAMSEARGKIFAMDEELGAARQSLAELREKLDLTLDAHAKTTSEKEEHEATIAAANERLATLEQTLNTVRTETESSIADHAAKVRQGELNLAQAKAQLDAAVAENQALQGQITEAQGQATALEQTLSTERAQSEASIAELTAKVEQGETGLAQLQSELDALGTAAQAEKEALQGQIHAAQGRVVELEQTLTKAQTQAEADRQTSAQTLVEAHKLYTRYSELGAKQTDGGMLLSLADEDLRFPSGMSVLPEGELVSLDRIAATLTEFPKLTARIEGHTDSAGSDETNQELSQARADAVMQGLVERGVAADRLSAQGKGETMPIADNNTATGRRQNRRVEIYVVEGGK